MEQENNSKNLIYPFTHPTWERETNENINKIIIRSISKNVDISSYTINDIKIIKHLCKECLANY